ncbi:hypothetical protein niasHS_003171 [Heterodera schachtii]|uniref:Uncharacterized protein n=1 Tax=Heterodera schachtii TaxID=97005 RepID=A0ABD2KFP9_HETSC
MEDQQQPPKVSVGTQTDGGIEVTEEEKTVPIEKVDVDTQTDDGTEEMEITDDEKTILTVKEAARAVVAHESVWSEPVEMAYARNGKGETRRRKSCEKLGGKDQQLEDVEFCLASKLGVELVLKRTIASDEDIRDATNTVEYMVKRSGAYREETGIRNFTLVKPGSETQKLLDQIIKRVLSECEKRVENIIEINKEKIKALADLLAKKHNYRLGKDEIQHFFSQYEAGQLPPGEEGEEKAMR